MKCIKITLIAALTLFSIKTNSSVNPIVIRMVERYYELRTIEYANVVGTVYYAVEAQCDDDPLITADSSIIDPDNVNELRWCALSRDLINQHDKWRNWNGKIKFGDTIYVESDHEGINGYWVVHDTMNARYKNSIDFLVDKDNGIYGKWYNLKIYSLCKYKKIVPVWDNKPEPLKIRTI